VKRPIAGGLRVIAAPGSGVARPVYATAADLRKHAGGYLETLLRLDVDETGFAEELADAREEFDRLLQLHYRGQGNLVNSALYGYAPYFGNRYGFRNAWLQQQLDAGGLVLTREIREYCALRAIGTILRRQKDEADRKAGSRYLLDADDLAAGISAEIQVGSSTQSTIIIHLGTVDRLKG
jgi:hypothetical protein